MNAIEILKEYLIKNKYGGLCHTDEWCACDIDDLQCCGESFGDCEPCYKIPAHCDDCETRAGCECPDESEWCYTLTDNSDSLQLPKTCNECKILAVCTVRVYMGKTCKSVYRLL